MSTIHAHSSQTLTDVSRCYTAVALEQRPIPQCTNGRTTLLYEPSCNNCYSSQAAQSHRSSQAAQSHHRQSLKASEFLPARRSECLSCLQHIQRKWLPHQAAAGMRVQHPKSSLLQTLLEGTGCPLAAMMPAERIDGKLITPRKCLFRHQLCAVAKVRLLDPHRCLAALTSHALLQETYRK